MQLVRPGLAIVATLALTLAACSSAPASTGGTGGPKDFSVTLSEFKFAATSFQLPAGVPITLSLKNAGTVDHDFSIEKLGLKIPLKPGDSASKDLGTLAAGTYDLVCTVPGHKEAGMVGKLVVK